MRGRIGRARGFTLIEMLVVLLVLALVGAIVVQRGPMRSPTIEAQAAARTIAGALRLARARAIAADRPATFALDVAAPSFRVDAGPPQRLPAGLRVSITTLAAGTRAGRGGVIGFAPDGSSTGGAVEIDTAAGRRIAVGVDWLTGRVSVADLAR